MNSPLVQRVRAYFAPVVRSTGQPTLFDPAQMGSFALDQPPSPWVDLGCIQGFARKSGSKIEAIRSGAPATTQLQVRTEIEATVAFSFETWGKLQLALASDRKPFEAEGVRLLDRGRLNPGGFHRRLRQGLGRSRFKWPRLIVRARGPAMLHPARRALRARRIPLRRHRLLRCLLLRGRESAVPVRKLPAQIIDLSCNSSRMACISLSRACVSVVDEAEAAPFLLLGLRSTGRNAGQQKCRGQRKYSFADLCHGTFFG